MKKLLIATILILFRNSAFAQEFNISDVSYSQKIAKIDCVDDIGDGFVNAVLHFDNEVPNGDGTLIFLNGNNVDKLQVRPFQYLGNKKFTKTLLAQWNLKEHKLNPKDLVGVKSTLLSTYYPPILVNKPKDDIKKLGESIGQKAEIRKYMREARSITPNRTWVRDIDNSLKWYYGYKEGNNFYYVKTTYSNGLSDLSTLYPTSYRRGDMTRLVRLNFVYESYQAYFDKRTKKEEVKVPVQMPKNGPGFNWLFENEPKKEVKKSKKAAAYDEWIKHKYQ